MDVATLKTRPSLSKCLSRWVATNRHFEASTSQFKDCVTSFVRSKWQNASKWLPKDFSFSITEAWRVLYYTLSVTSRLDQGWRSVHHFRTNKRFFWLFDSWRLLGKGSEPKKMPGLLLSTPTLSSKKFLSKNVHVFQPWLTSMIKVRNYYLNVFSSLSKLSCTHRFQTSCEHAQESGEESEKWRRMSYHMDQMVYSKRRFLFFYPHQIFSYEFK